VLLLEDDDGVSGTGCRVLLLRPRAVAIDAAVGEKVDDFCLDASAVLAAAADALLEVSVRDVNKVHSG